MPPLASVLGFVLRDVLLTADEYRAMADGLADTDGPATGSIALSAWIQQHADSLGRRYANEIDRHFRPRRAEGRCGQLQVTRTERGAQGQIEAERHGRAPLGLVGGDEPDADDRGEQVGEEESLDEGEGTHPGQAESDDEGEPHIAERHPARVHQVHGEEEHEEGESAQPRR